MGCEGDLKEKWLDHKFDWDEFRRVENERECIKFMRKNKIRNIKNLKGIGIGHLLLFEHVVKLDELNLFHLGLVN